MRTKPFALRSSRMRSIPGSRSVSVRKAEVSSRKTSAMQTGVGPRFDLSLLALALALALVQQPARGIPLRRTTGHLIQRRLEFRVAGAVGRRFDDKLAQLLPDIATLFRRQGLDFFHYCIVPCERSFMATTDNDANYPRVDGQGAGQYAKRQNAILRCADCGFTLLRFCAMMLFMLSSVFRPLSFVLCLLTSLFCPLFSVLGQESVCAQVRIEILQELTLEREAFEARMTINNGLGIPLDQLSVDVNFADSTGNPVRATSNPNDLTAKFFIRYQTGSGLPSSIAGGTSSRILWLIIPAPGAAGQDPKGELYSVGATLRYRASGVTNEVKVTPDTIWVKPMPDLTLDYFLPSEVYGDDPFTTYEETPVPFNLGVRVKNTGYGWARQLKINSAQPRIVENQQGLLVDFRITGSEVNGASATTSLLADFGDISPNRSGVARWIMISTLSGRFVEFTASYTHSDELGGELTSLISGQPRTHFLVRDVLVDLPGRDAIRDFLAKDGDGLRVYESENADIQATDYSGSASLTGSEGRYTLRTPAAGGFLYVKLTDPQNGQQLLKQVVRADGKPVNPANAWLSQTWDRVGLRWNYFVNLFEVSNPDGLTYAVQYDMPPSPTNRPPRLDPMTSWTLVAGNYLSTPITATDPDDNKLTYSLEPGAPAEDAIDPVIGLYTWRPTQTYAGTTNTIRVRVTDNGNPNLSDIGQFERDFGAAIASHGQLAQTALASRYDGDLRHGKHAVGDQQEQDNPALDQNLLDGCKVAAFGRRKGPKPVVESVLPVCDGKITNAAEEFAALNPPLPPVSPDWSPVAHYGGYDNAPSSAHSHTPVFGADGRLG